MTLVDVDLEVEKSEGAAEVEPVVATVKADHEPTQAAADLPSIHTDPFAAREGKTLTWKNINMTLVSSFFTCHISTSIVLVNVLNRDEYILLVSHIICFHKRNWNR
jgi:hypothetical protein